MQSKWLRWLQLAVIALLLVAKSTARVLDTSTEGGGRHLSRAKTGAARRTRIRARREAHQRRAALEELAVSSADDEEVPKDTSHSAVKAIKSRIAKERKRAAQEADDAEEGSERRLQARRGVAEKGALTQQGDSNAVRMREEEEVTPLEEFELEMTGTLDDVEGEELASELHTHHSVAVTVKGQVATSREDSYMHDSEREPDLEDSYAAIDAEGVERTPALSDEEAHLMALVHTSQQTWHPDDKATHDADAIDMQFEDTEDDQPSSGQKLAAQKVRHDAAAAATHSVATAKDGAASVSQKIAGEKGGHEAVVTAVHSKPGSGDGKLPAVKKLPPWFKEGFEDSSEKPRPKLGSGRAHKAQVLSREERWLRVHQRHLGVIWDAWDVILYGDDLVEAWRGTFQGQAYGPFSEIPAVWESSFGAKEYSALAAGIAGDGVEQLKWRLENGELPPLIPPKVIVLAVGTNSKGMAGDCRKSLAEESAAEMTELLHELRGSTPHTQMVLLAPLPKGDYWPNRCTPAFSVFNQALQDFADENSEHVHYMDMSSSFLVRPSSDGWANVTAATKQEINEMFMPDAQHPSAAGMRIIAAELEPLVSRLISEAPADMGSI